MRLELTGRQIDITAGIRRIIESKLAKLERMLDHAALSAQVVVSREKTAHRVDVTLHARGEKFLHGMARGESVATAMTAAADKIGQQARTVKGKFQDRKRRSPSGTGPQTGPAAGARTASSAPVRRDRTRMPRILKAERQTIRTMSVSDAVAQIDGGGGLVVFLDAETSRIAVLYRSPGGDLTLIETRA
jgi:putative sigma-54 modulation protein